MLIVEFRHAPVGTPLLNICGLPLGVRSGLEGKKIGFDTLCFLVHEEDQEQLSELIEADRRLNGSQIISGEWQTLKKCVQDQDIRGGRLTILAGNYLWKNSERFVKKKEGTNLLKGIAAENGQTCIIQKEGDAASLISGEDINAAHLFERQLQATDPPGNVEKIVVQGCWVHSGNDKKKAESFLLSGLAKSVDGVVSRNINRKISITITRRLMDSPIKPNHVTAVVFLIGILSGPSILFIGGYWGLVCGGFLYWASAVLDGCDGELSRLKFQGTFYGAWFDTVVDDLVGLSYVLGLYCWLTTENQLWWWVGFTALLCYFITLGPRYYVMAKFLGTGDCQKLAAIKKEKKEPGCFLQRFVQLLEDTVCRLDFIAFAALVTALMKGEKVFAVCFMVGCIASAIDSLVVFFRMKRDAHNSGN